MMKPLLPKYLLLFGMLLLLAACQANGSSPTQMPSREPTSSPPVLRAQATQASTLTHTPLPTAKVTPTLPAESPLTDEALLARAVMPSSDRVYCSWQILGQAKLKLFVWAYCVDVGMYSGAKGAGPAIIHLDEQGHYRQVEWALGYPENAAIVKQFPQDAQQAIADPNNKNGLQINMQALEWGVQMRGVAFKAPYILPLFDPAGTYCVEGPTKMGQNLPAAEEKDYSGWKTYTQLEDGFSFNLPADWSVEESWFSCSQRPPAPHSLFLQPPGSRYRLTIAFRKSDEAENIQRSGTPAGDFSDAGTLIFLGKQVRIQRLIYEKRDMAVFYNNSAEFPAGGLLFTLSLDITSDPQNNGSIPVDIETLAGHILASAKPYLPATPTSEIKPTPGLTAEISPGVPAGKILFPATWIDGLALDDEYVYWSVSGKMLRQHLTSPENSEPETVAKTTYPNGRFGLLNSQRKEDWLFFVDCEGMGIPGNWTLFALNVKTREKKAIVRSQDTGQIYAYAVDGDRVVVSLADHATDRKCQDDSVLAVITISTLQRQELDRACFDSPYNWTGVALSEDTIIASRFYENTRTFELVRYNLKSGSGQPLNQATYPPVSYVDGGSLAAAPAWLAWERSENSAFLFNPQTGDTRQVAPSGVEILKFPQISGRWLSWRVNDQPVVYDIEQNTLRYLAKLEAHQRLTDFVLYGNRAAWVVVLQADQGGSDNVIEWTNLPAQAGASTAP